MFVHEPGSWVPEWLDFGRLALASLVGARRDDDEARDEVVDVALVEARQALRLALDRTGSFADLVANAALNPADAEVLAVALTCEVDLPAQRMLAGLQREPGPSRVSLGTLAAVFGEAHAGVLTVAPDAPLRRCAFVDVLADGPWLDHRLVVHPTVIWSVLGDAGIDPDLPLAMERIESALEAGATFTVVTGRDRVARRRAAADATRGESFLVAPAPDTDGTWRALVREATITGSGVVIEAAERLPEIGKRWIERADHLAWSLTSPLELDLGVMPARPWIAVEASVTEPTDAEWQAVLGDAPRRHRLTLDQLTAVGPAFAANGGDIDAAVRRLVSGRLEQLSTRVRPSRGWDDLVLAADKKAALRSIVDRYQHSSEVYDRWGFSPVPSRGVVGLFAGPSGTGKTMAAEVVAGTLGLDLFRLDLSAVVSKYIGETEKNLEQVFDAASAGNLLLFFDEADSLFGKRTEIKDTRDRYANVEVSYLLQRVESYNGLIVLATNYERNIDEAFLRRIHTRIHFEIPEPAQRREIWDRNLPPSAPTKDLDTEWLAERFELSGGSIRNAAVHAAFEAATAGGPITMECAVRGIASELHKTGRLLDLAIFGEHADAVRGDPAP